MAIEKRTGKGGASYRVRVDLPDDNGERQFRYGTFRTRKEAESTERAWKTEVENGIIIQGAKLTVTDLFALWLDVLRATNPKPRTVVEYERTINTNILPAIGAMLVRKVQPATVDALYASLRAAGGTDDKIHRCHKRLAQAFDYAVKRRIIAVNPMLAIDAPTVRSASPIILTPPQIQRFLAFAAKDGYNPLWLLIVQTGVRRGEALGLRWTDVDLERGRIQVRQAVEVLDGKPNVTTPKTPAALRTITLFPESIAALRAHKAHQNERRLIAGTLWQPLDLVFSTATGGPLNPNNILGNLRDIQRAANGEAKRNRNPVPLAPGRRGPKPIPPAPAPSDEERLPHFDIHDLRHTHATHLLVEGWPITTVSRRLGHANPAITLKLYAHALTDTPEPNPITPAAFAFTGTA